MRSGSPPPHLETALRPTGRPCVLEIRSAWYTQCRTRLWQPCQETCFRRTLVRAELAPLRLCKSPRPACRLVRCAAGLELDVHVNTYRKAGRHASMDVSTDLPLMAALPPNQWSFALAASPDAAVDRRGFRALTPETLLERSRAALAARSGLHGLRSLSLALSAADQRGSGLAPRDIVQWALFDHGVLQVRCREQSALTMASRPFITVPITLKCSPTTSSLSCSRLSASPRVEPLPLVSWT